jgi:hypothetical protein
LLGDQSISDARNRLDLNGIAAGPFKRLPKATHEPVEAVVTHLGVAPQMIEQLTPREHLSLPLNELQEQLHDERLDGRFTSRATDAPTNRVDSHPCDAKRKSRRCVHQIPSLDRHIIG